MKYRTESDGRNCDKDWKPDGRVRDGKVYDENWRLKYRIDGDRVYDKDWNLRYRYRIRGIISMTSWEPKVRIGKGK